MQRLGLFGVLTRLRGRRGGVWAIGLAALALSVLAPPTALAAPRWQNPVVSPHSMRKVDMVSASKGWATDDNGVLRTTDGGTLWSLQKKVSGASVTSIDFVDELFGWAVLSDGTIMRTTNGGQDWAEQDWPEEYQQPVLNDVAFADRLHGWAIGSRFVPPTFPWETGYSVPVVLRTDDGGNTWVNRSYFTGGQYCPAPLSIRIISASEAYLERSYDAWTRTDDGGQTWTPVTFPDSGGLMCIPADVHFPDADHGWAAAQLYSPAVASGMGIVILSSSDRGQSWTVRYRQQEANWYDVYWGVLTNVHFSDAQHGWVWGRRAGGFFGYAGNGGEVFETRDGGATWQKTLLPETRSTSLDGPVSMSFPDPDHGIVSAQNFTIAYGLAPGVVENAHMVSAVAASSLSGIPGANLSVSGEAHTADAEARSYFTSKGVKTIRAQATGYRIAKTIADMQWGRASTLLLDRWKDDGKPYVSMVSQKRSPTEYGDLLHSSATFSEGSSDRAELICEAEWNGRSPGTFILYQESARLTSTDGRFSFIPGKVFVADKPVYLRLVSGDDVHKSDPSPVKLKMTKSKTGEVYQTGFKLGEETGVTVSKDVPILGGTEIKAGFDGIPVQIETEGNTFRVGIGTTNRDEMNEKWADFKKSIDKVKKSKKRADALSVLNEYGRRKARMPIRPKVNVQPDVIGYGEGVIDSDGTMRFTRGYIIATVDEEVTWTNQTFVGPVPVYIEGLIGAKIEVDMGVKHMLEQKQQLVTYANLTVTPKLGVGGGVGVKGAASVGAEGRGEMPIFMNTFEEYMTADLEAYLKVKVSALFIFTAEKEWGPLTWPLFDTRKSAAASVASALTPVPEQSLYDDSALKLSPRLSRQVRAQAAPPANAPFTTVVPSVMPASQPQMARVGEKLVAVYQTDDLERSSLNRTVLMYTVKSGDSWSAPKPVWDNGAPDGAASLVSDGTKAHLVWQKSSSAVVAEPGATDEQLLDALARRQEIAVASWDAATDTFGSREYVTSDTTLDMTPRAALDGDGLLVSWVKNSANDVFGATGTNSIFTAAQSQGWSQQQVATTPLPVLDAAVARVDGGSTVAYSVDTDADLDTSADIELFSASSAGVERITDNTVAENHPVFAGGKLYWSDGELKTRSLSSDTITSAFPDGQLVGKTFALLSDGARSGVAWLAPDADAGTRVMARWLPASATATSAPAFELAQPTGGITALSALHAGEGWQALVAATRDGITSVDYARFEGVARPVLEDVRIAEETATGAGMQVDLSVANTGTAQMRDMRLRIIRTPGSWLVTDMPLPVSVPAGGSLVCTVTAPLPQPSSETSFTFQLVSSANPTVVSNTVEQAIGQSDFTLDVQHIEGTENDLLVSTLSNESFGWGSGRLVVREVDGAKRVVANYQVESMGPGESRVYETTVSRPSAGASATAQFAATAEGTPTAAYSAYTVEIIPDTAESLAANNAAVVAVSAETTPLVAPDEPAETPVIPVTGVKLETSEQLRQLTVSDVGRQIALRYVTVPASATAQSVTWSSSDSAVVGVDADGVLTVNGPGAATVTVTAGEGALQDTVSIYVARDVTHAVVFESEGDVAAGALWSDGTVPATAGLPILSRPGWTLVGWSDTTDGLPLDLTSLMVTQPLRLYAVWTQSLPTAPTMLAAPERSATSTVQVTWSPGAWANSHEYRVNGGASHSAEETGALIGGLAPGSNVIEIRAVNGAGASEWVALTPAITYTAPTVQTLKAPAFRYDLSTTLSGTLRAVDGTGCAGQAIALQRSLNAGATWSALATVTTGTDGTWRFPYNPSSSYQRNQSIRAVYVGAADRYVGSSSAAALPVTVYLSTPAVSTSSPARGRSFTVSGSLKPKFKRGTYPVKAYFYRRGADGVYRYYSSTRMVARDYGSYTKVSGSRSLPYRGRWRIRLVYGGTTAAVNGYRYSATNSGWRYVTVK